MKIGISHKAVAHLAAGIALGDTVISIHPTEYGSVFSAPDDVYLMLRGPVNRELVKIDLSASVWGSALTIVRGQGGTTAVAWPQGSMLFATTHEDHYNSILQRGIARTIDYNPNEILAPLFAGEEVYQDGPAGCERWWKSFNAVNPYWDLISGAKCGSENYEDIGWDYDLLIQGPPWTMKKSLYDENSSLRWPYSLVYHSVDHTLFVGTKYLANIWKSSDGGATWALNKDLSSNDEGIYSLVYDAYHDVLIAGTSNGGQIWRSTDGGDNWTYVQRLGNQNDINALVYDPNSHVVIAGTYNDAQLWKSDDGGATWAMKKDISIEPDAETHILALCFDSSRNRILASTGLNDAQIWMSTDAGENWTEKVDLSFLAEPTQSRIYDMAYDSTNDVIIAGTYPDAMLWASGDGGENWTLKKDLGNESPGQTTIDSLAFNPDTGQLFAGTAYDGQVWVSDDGGDTWTLDQDLGRYSIYSLVYDDFNNKMIAGIGDNFGSPGAEIWTRGNL